MISIYISCSIGSWERNLKELYIRLEFISRALENKRRTHQNTELIVIDDFNYWDSI